METSPHPLRVRVLCCHLPHYGSRSFRHACATSNSDHHRASSVRGIAFVLGQLYPVQDALALQTFFSIGAKFFSQLRAELFGQVTFNHDFNTVDSYR